MENKEKSPEQELVESIGLMIDKGLESTTDVYSGVVKSVDGKRAVVNINGRNQNVTIASATVSIGSVVRVFVPKGNMSAAFIIKAESNGGGGGGTTTAAYGDLSGKPQINGVTLLDNKTSKELNLYGAGNPPPYPVTSVNGKTGDVTIDTGGNVDSVNGKTGDVVLDASDVGALSDTTVIPSKTSELTNDSGYITNSALTPYAKKTDVPTKTSQLNNDSGFITDIPIASSTQLGGVKPVAKTADMTQQVGVDANGALYTAKENYIVRFSFDSSTRKWTADKTTAEIKEARDSGNKFIYAVAYTYSMLLWDIDTDSTCYFGRFNDSGNVESTLSYAIFLLWDDGTVTTNSYDVLAKDDISSNLNTDKTSASKVPSCKATYDAIPHPETKTDAQTQAVGMDSNGKLWTAPSGGGTSTGDMLKSVYDPTGSVATEGGIANYVANNAPVTSVNNKTGAVEIRELPSVTASDNGKFLRVVNGAWSAEIIPSANGGSF